MRRKMLIALVSGVIALGFASASAAPIVCPPSQVETHTADGGWFCVNPAGNADNSEAPKH